MKLPLTYYGNPILRKKTAPISKITEEIRQLVLDMAETLEEHKGCGLAAPQIGHSISLFITCIPIYEEENILPGELLIFINPKIVEVSKEHYVYEEGCLSIPGLGHYEVSRPTTIKIQATDLNGNLFEKEFTEFDAHVIMHENDHLNGVLFIDRLTPRIKKKIELKLNQIKKKMN